MLSSLVGSVLWQCYYTENAIRQQWTMGVTLPRLVWLLLCICFAKSKKVISYYSKHDQIILVKFLPCPRCFHTLSLIVGYLIVRHSRNSWLWIYIMLLPLQCFQHEGRYQEIHCTLQIYYGSCLGNWVRRSLFKIWKYFYQFMFIKLTLNWSMNIHCSIP